MVTGTMIHSGVRKRNLAAILDFSLHFLSLSNGCLCSTNPFLSTLMPAASSQAIISSFSPFLASTFTVEPPYWAFPATNMIHPFLLSLRQYPLLYLGGKSGNSFPGSGMPPCPGSPLAPTPPTWTIFYSFPNSICLIHIGLYALVNIESELFKM